MESYVVFKQLLADLCERGVVSKSVKNTFNGIKEQDPGALLFEVCSDLSVLFENSDEKSKEYESVAAAVEWLFTDALKGTEREEDGAKVCAYIRLTVRANGGDKKAFDILKEHIQDFYRAVNNIRYGVKLF